MSSVPENRTCPSCGAAIPANAPQGICPKCLMAAAAVATDAGPTGGKRPEPPSLERLAAVFPQLEVLEFIGQGGMGAVYKARQKQLDRIVALKVLPPGIGGDAAFAERFTREAKALAKLLHPNIVALFEFGQADGIYYLLMEYVDGVSLGQLLRASRVSPREALAIVPQICDALQYAHDQGIVHRDIKPENILLDRRGRVKVADFGLAKLVATGVGRAGSPLPAVAAQTDDGAHGVTRPTDALTDAGKLMGTPAYMAPEQVEHPADVDHRADIYALGVVFYQMLTGELPGKRMEPPSKKVQIDVRLDEVVLRALEKNPELRYQQVSEVKTMVETIAGTPDPSTGRDEATHTEVGKPRQAWWTWSPLQSLEVREICAHLTKAERNHLLVLVFLFTVWIVGTCFRIPAFIRAQSGSGKWIVALVWVTLFAVSIPMFQRLVRHFLCSTAWARERGFAPKHLRLFSFSRGNLRKVCAVLAVGLGLVLAQHKAITRYLGLGSSPQPEQIQQRHPRKAAGQPVAPFGPVIERVLYDTTTGRDCFLDLETGRLLQPPPEVMSLFAATNWQKSYMDEPKATDPMRAWVWTSGADLVYGAPAFNRERGLVLLDGEMIGTQDYDYWGIGAAPVAKLLQEAEETEQRKVPGTPSLLGLPPFVRDDQLRCSQAFRTKDGTMGVLQVIGFTDNSRGVKIRYKLVLPQSADLSTQPAHAVHANNNTAGFGPVTERTVNLSEPEQDMFLSFETGKVMKEPGGRLNTPEPEKLHVADEVLAWAGSSGADLLIRFCVGKTGSNSPFAVPQLLLRSLDMAMFPTNTGAWDGLHSRDIATAVSSAPQHGWWQQLYAYAALDHTFLFRTRQGNAGILLVTGYTDKPRSVKLFYKLVQATPAATPVRMQAEVSPAATGARLPSALQFRWVAREDETNAPAKTVADPNDRSGNRKLRVLKEVVLDGSAVAQVGWHPGRNGTQVLVLRWSNAGRQRFAELTAANVHRQLAVVFEGKVLTAPIIAGAIDSSTCELAGVFTEAEMKRMIAYLSGAWSGTEELQFGPTHEFVLPQRTRTGRDLVFLNLVTQRWMTNSTSERGSREFYEWVRQNDADLSGGFDERAIQGWQAQANPTAAAAEPASPPLAFCYNTVVLPAETNAWDLATPTAVKFRWELASQEPEKETMVVKLAGTPDTFYVRTHDNGYGLLQVIGFSDNPRGLRICYRMVVARRDEGK